jgi:hypothetical protein
MRTKAEMRTMTIAKWINLARRMSFIMASLPKYKPELTGGALPLIRHRTSAIV